MVNTSIDFRQLVVWEDESILAINKPAGLLTIRDGYNPDLPYVTALAAPQYGKLWVVHRLDKETSGILLLARTAEAHRALNIQFESREVHKIYHALIWGLPPWDEYTARFPLKVNGDRRHRTVLDAKNGKPASTDFKILERFANACLVEAQPKTGYTHQIRAHLFAEGHPLIGDRLYSAKGPGPGKLLERVGLHAFRIAFKHPMNQSPIQLEASYPLDFMNAIELLRVI